MKCDLRKTDNGTKLFRVKNKMESNELQNDLIILNDWADKIHVDRCKVMHLGNIPSNHVYRIRLRKSLNC